MLHIFVAGERCNSSSATSFKFWVKEMASSTVAEGLQANQASRSSTLAAKVLEATSIVSHSKRSSLREEDFLTIPSFCYGLGTSEAILKIELWEGMRSLGM